MNIRSNAQPSTFRKTQACACVFGLIFFLVGCGGTEPINNDPVETAPPIVVPEESGSKSRIVPELTVPEKLDQLASFVQTAWADGDGFLLPEENEPDLAENDIVCLNLKWNQIDRSLRQKFDELKLRVDEEACCVFTGRGSFFSNNDVYPAILFRAQGKTPEIIVDHQVKARLLSRIIPMIHGGVLDTEKGLSPMSVREKLEGVTLPDDVTLNLGLPDEPEILTSWIQLMKSDGTLSSFEWRLQFEVQEANGLTETEFQIIDVEGDASANRVDVVSTIQFRESRSGEIVVEGPAMVTPLALQEGTVVLEKYEVRVPVAREFEPADLNKSEFAFSDGFVSPIFFIRASNSLRERIREIQTSVAQRLMETPDAGGI